MEVLFFRSNESVADGSSAFVVFFSKDEPHNLVNLSFNVLVKLVRIRQHAIPSCVIERAIVQPIQHFQHEVSEVMGRCRFSQDLRWQLLEKLPHMHDCRTAATI